jgi:o-succinylbenzoate synthase
MKITRVTAREVEVPLEKPFVVSLGTISACETVYVKLETDAGLVGYGEGAGLSFVTGETNGTVLNTVRLFEPVLLGQDPYAIAHIHRKMDERIVRNSAAKAAVDLALYDLMAKGANLPLYKYLGGVSNTVEIDMTIGLDEPKSMAETAARLFKEGFRELKIKAGADDAQDEAAIRLIREAAPDAHLKVDANQGWTVHRALGMLRIYAECGVEALEQPVPYWDLDGLKYIRDKSPIPIMADESCFSPQDASKIVRLGAADIINIKLMKCGGLYRALQINDIAEAAGVNTMLGCMLESKLSIAAGAALVAARPNFIYADLDSFLEHGETALIRGSFEYETPFIRLTDTPGIGVELDI